MLNNLHKMDISSHIGRYSAVLVPFHVYVYDNELYVRLYERTLRMYVICMCSNTVLALCACVLIIHR